uniref:Membrane anchored junction protein n=1 Tax=Latimeria chalumnae TaxID=7897 RepID=M3XLE3_LATCH
MPLKPFSYPNSETRFLHAGMTLFKFKIRYGNAPREGLENDGSNTQELEDAIRAVLGNLDALQPFTTKHFTIFPYKSKWVRVSELRFKHRNSFLTPYPYVCTLYVQVNSKQQNINYGNEATSRQSSQQVKAIQDSDPLFAATQHRLVDSLTGETQEQQSHPAEEEEKGKPKRDFLISLSRFFSPFQLFFGGRKSQ